MSIEIERSKKGLPCLWESGGGMSNTGKAIVIAGKFGEALKPIYIRKSGSLSCGHHALIPIYKGCLVIKTSHHRGDFETSVYRISSISKDSAELTLLNEFSNGEWDKEPDSKYMRAIEACEDKAHTYHCRYPKFIKGE